MHYALRSLPPRVEATVAMTVMGGLFGFLLIPLTFFVLLSVVVEVLSDGQIPTSMTLQYVVIPFFVLYVVQILILDKTHLKVENAGPPRPRYFLEDAAWKFADSVWKYYPTVECIPCRYSTAYHKNNNSTNMNKTDNNKIKNDDDDDDDDDDGVFLPPGRQYIFGVHPHGIHCLPLGLFGTQNGAFDTTFPGLYGPKLIGICATVIFKIPVVRELFFHMGYIDASRSVCDRALRVPNQSLFICIGGEEESMLSTKGKDEVVLLKRKGFVRLALAHGCALVPCFGVNNTDTYKTYSFGLKWRQWLQKKTGIALPIFHGRWFTTLPYPVPIKMLVGEPIYTPKPQQNTDGDGSSSSYRPPPELVDEYHAKYVEALKDIHAQHVHDRTLIVR